MARGKMSVALLVVALATATHGLPMMMGPTVMGALGGYGMGYPGMPGFGGTPVAPNAGVSLKNGAATTAAVSPYGDMITALRPEPNVLVGSQIIYDNQGQVFEGMAITLRQTGGMGEMQAGMMNPLGSMMGMAGYGGYGYGGYGYGMGALGAMGSMGGMGSMHQIEATLEVKLQDNTPAVTVFLVVLESVVPGRAGTNSHCVPSSQGAVMLGPDNNQMDMMNSGFGAMGNMLGGMGTMYNPLNAYMGMMGDPMALGGETDFGVIKEMTLQGGTNVLKLDTFGHFMHLNELAGRGVALCEDIVIANDGSRLCDGNTFPVLMCANLSYGSEPVSLGN